MNRDIDFRIRSYAKESIPRTIYDLTLRWALVPPSEEVKAKHSKGYGFN